MRTDVPIIGEEGDVPIIGEEGDVPIIGEEGLCVLMCLSLGRVCAY